MKNEGFYALESWGMTFLEQTNPYQPPECAGHAISGAVFDNPHFEDGSHITTSRIRSMEVVDGELFVHTASGSVYHLRGAPHPEYEAQFPGARDRFIKLAKDAEALAKGVPS